MITIVNHRNNGGYVCPPMLRSLTLGDAFEYLVLYELGYGAEVRYMSNEKLSLRTLVLGCIDDTEVSADTPGRIPTVVGHGIYMGTTSNMEGRNFCELGQLLPAAANTGHG